MTELTVENVVPTIPITTPNEVNNLLSSSFIIKLTIGKPGISKEIPGSKMRTKDDIKENEESPVVVDVEEVELISARKKKFTSQVYEEICRIDRKARKLLKDCSFPLRGNRGERIVPNNQFNKLMRKLGALEFQRGKYIFQFVENWGKISEEGRLALKGLGNIEDYPTKEEILRQFTWSKILKGTEANFTLPKCVEMNPEIFEKVAQETRERMLETAEHVTLCAIQQAQEVVKKLVEALGNEEEGEVKKFNTKYIDAAKKVFNFLGEGGGNITNNKELAQICAMAEALLAGESKEKVRRIKQSEVAREQITANFTSLKEKIDSLVEVHKGRVFSIAGDSDDDDEEEEEE